MAAGLTGSSGTAGGGGSAIGAESAGGGGIEVTGSKGGGNGWRRGGGRMGRGTRAGAGGKGGGEAAVSFGGVAGSRIRLMTFSESLMPFTTVMFSFSSDSKDTRRVLLFAPIVRAT